MLAEQLKPLENYKLDVVQSDIYLQDVSLVVILHGLQDRNKHTLLQSGSSIRQHLGIDS